jgi:glutamine synthetase adenylyltransferase
MSDTPETDKKASPHIGFYSCATVPAEFARSLERERDEARAQAKKLEGAYEDATNYYARWSELIEERDEAQAEVNRLQKGGCARDQKTTQFCAEVVNALKERDEAREIAHRFRCLYYTQLGIEKSASWFPWEAKNE